MLKQFKMGTKIITGIDALSTIQTLSLKSVLIICDPFMLENGLAQKIEQLLKDKNVGCTIFSEIIPDPTIDVVTKGLLAAINLSPDGIIALGGGSAMDAAKVISHMYRTAEKDASVQLICIPTTSGTGSEVTSFAVISDPQNHSKYALVDEQMVPDLAILDPVLTVSVPKDVTTDTGFDVFTHCMEALASTDATDFTDAASEKALQMIWKDLVPVVNDGENLALREQVHNASCLAGIAFSEASLGICHSLAHALGGQFHIPHGRANALLLPHVIRYNAGLELENEIPSLVTYQRIAKSLGFQAGTAKATVHAMINGVNRQLKQLAISPLITDHGIDSEEFLAAIPEMAAKAMDDKCTITNPRKPSIQELEQLYKRLLRGGY
ncbi:alcohol dehydrogenase [Enterococcus plantarum]|uniref:Alcohol dehydrogenase n=1 Tax=Enterococcus plantarum TaxID=1077675 RepID=A0A2W3ZH35_9ENTE|nr:1-propanol dehydrogenase PduQ [Enterococcus plantarum]PZL75837.1 alcohol dehydrogenase [Enterococcus plantarum]